MLLLALDQVSDHLHAVQPKHVADNLNKIVNNY
jgi:hypothetical protein